MTKQQENFIANAAVVRIQLKDLDEQLQEQIDAIRTKAFQEKRPLTAEENARRQTLRSAQGECRETLTLLADEVLRQIDQSSAVKNLRDRLSRVNAALQSDLEGLERIKKIAAVAAQVADAVAKIAAAAAKLAA